MICWATFSASFVLESNQVPQPRYFHMKNVLLLSALCLSFASIAQTDNLKTFRKLTKKHEKTSDYVFIPSGTIKRVNEQSEDKPFVQETPSTDRFEFNIDSFFMGKFEISNGNYLEFVTDVLATNPLLAQSYLPDTLVWRDKMGFNEKYTEYYFRHPAYQNHPVVGVSYNQMVAYALWRTEKYDANEDRRFKKVRFRIPTEDEWEYAAKGGLTLSNLTWGSNSTLDYKGNARANFRAMSQLGIYRDSAVVEFQGETKMRQVFLSNGHPMERSSYYSVINNYADVTAPVNAYNPNGYGLYNMSGNVEEMVNAQYVRTDDLFQFDSDTIAQRTQLWGVTKGGSWNDPGYYLQIPTRQFFNDPTKASREVGFRLVMDIVEF